MFKDIFLFEIRYRLRRPSFYIYVLICLLAGIFYGTIMAGGFGLEVAQMLTGGGQNLANSPYMIHQIMMAVNTVVGIFVIAAFMAVPVYRDFRHGAHSLFFTTPMQKGSYLFGRFWGSFVVVLFILLFIGVGMAIALSFPYDEPIKMGPMKLSYFVWPYFYSIIPFTFFTGSLFFSFVSLTRNQLFIYLNAILVLILFMVAGSAAEQIDNRWIAALVDPSGGQVFAKITEYWTVPQKNTLLLPFNGIAISHLILWASIAAGILLFTYRKFAFSYAQVQLLRKSKKIRDRSVLPGSISLFPEKVDLPAANKVFSFRKNLSLLLFLTKSEIRRLFRSVIFWVLVGVGILFLVLSLNLASQNQIFGTPNLPVSYQMVDSIRGAMIMFIYALIVFFSGELIWRDRNLKMAEIQDALPTPAWIAFISKLICILCIPVIMLGSGMIIGILHQVGHGFYEVKLGLYLSRFFVFGFFDLFLFTVLCLFTQALSNNKFVGFGLSVGLFFLLSKLLSQMGVEDRLFEYMSGYYLRYSDMNGFGHFVGPFLAYKFYWMGLGIVLLILANALSPRGVEMGLMQRFRQLGSRLDRSARIGIILGLSLFVSLGAFIYYQTHIVNPYRTQESDNEELAYFEKEYGQYKNTKQPRIRAVNMHVDLIPQKQSFEATGHYELENIHNSPIDSIHIIGSLRGMEIDSLSISKGSKQVFHDEDIDYFILKLDSALAPGEKTRLYFKGGFRPKGFTHSGINTRVVENGSFLDQAFFPSIGYHPDIRIQDAALRKKYELPPLDRMAARSDMQARMNTMFSYDSDWIDFEIIVSTDPDQIAVAPGYLQKSWEENDRKYFHYKMDSKMVKFFSIVSARYSVMQDSLLTADSQMVKLEIFHHPSHTYNLDRMMAAMKASLRYYTHHFGPYQHKQVRILEFPRYMTFAQSFPNTIPYAESSGFISDVENGLVDLPTYGTAHELAHQWFGHQVIGGKVRGFQFLSESLSQYGAMMVMEKELGEDKVKDYLKYELDRYLNMRTGERRQEYPALQVENQFYIQYNKGSLIMYALKDYIGEDSLNAAIADYLQAVKFQDPPYTTTLEWLEYIRARTPDSLQYMLDEMFESVILYDLRVLEAESEEQEDGRHLIKARVLTQKVEDDGKGNETSLPIKDYIDIGVFGQKEIEGKKESIPLYFKKHLFIQDTTDIEIWVDAEPKAFGIDPYHKLIDRKSTDNEQKLNDELGQLLKKLQ